MKHNKIVLKSRITRVNPDGPDVRAGGAAAFWDQIKQKIPPDRAVFSLQLRGLCGLNML